VEREKLLERLRARAEALEKLELRDPEDLLRASALLQRVWEEVAGYARRAHRYELFDILKRVEESERVIYATYATIELNGGGEEILQRVREDLEEAAKALREILAIL
jgi:biotin-(acetyl-CoA carboxylase) ligase